MPHGSLEVFLVSAKGLEDKDFVLKMDPYVILTCRTQEQKSSVASGQGSQPVWNENFLFNVSEGVEELKLKIMDSDTFSDDFVGEAEIPLNPAFRERSIPPTAYNVVKDKEFCGEIKVGLTFTPEGRNSGDHGRDEGGWNQSSHSEKGRNSGDYGRDEGGWNQSSHSERGRNSRDHERDDSYGGRRRHSSRERRDSGSDEDRRRGGSHGRRRHSSDED